MFISVLANVCNRNFQHFSRLGQGSPPTPYLLATAPGGYPTLGMAETDQFRRFGAYLRSVRHRRGLTLKNVADASNQIASTPAGRISHPHLSQIETGKPIGISLSKVLLLASLYRLEPEQIIEQTPDRIRRRLIESWGEWRAQHRPEPAPVRYLPQLICKVDQQLDEALLGRARDVRIPLGREEAARRLIRWTLITTITPAYLDQESPDISGFWDQAERSYGGDAVTWIWRLTVDEFQEWLLYEQQSGASLLELIDHWSVDFTGPPTTPEDQSVTCRFRDRRRDRRYGARNVPAIALRGVRWRQTAQQLGAAAPASQGLPPPPNPLDGLLDYLSFVIHPDARPVDRPGTNTSSFASFLLALHRHTGLGDPDSAQRSEVESLAELLNALKRS